MSIRWLLYGAYGFTGELIAREAARRGHRPVLAGRNAEKLGKLAHELSLPELPLALDDPERLAHAVSGFDLVVHLAGPFTHTALPMVDACLRAGVSYVDVAGELALFGKLYARDREARDRGIAIIPGCGFDVVPSDCLSLYLAGRLPNSVRLELAIDADTRPSSGTVGAAIEVMRDGGAVRRNGTIIPQPLGERGPNVRFSTGERTTMAVPLADLESAWRSTHIPNITTLLALPAGLGAPTRAAARITEKLMKIRPIARIASGFAKGVLGKGNMLKEGGKAEIWGRVTDADGACAEAWITTMEPYRYTVESILAVVERLERQPLSGALSPAAAFGPDFALEIPGTTRRDRLEI